MTPISTPTPTHPEPAVRIPPGTIACLALAAFGSGLSMRVNDALLPRLAGEFGVPLGTAAQVISFFAIAYGLAQLLFGPLGDRFGKYRVIGWAAAASACTAALCALAPGFDELRWARALAGATAAAVIPLSMAWIGDTVPYAQRQPVLARFLIGQIVGLTSGVWLGGFAADHLSWRAPYVAIALLYGLTAAALLAFNRRLPPEAKPMHQGDGSPLRRTAKDFAAVVAKPWARTVMALVFCEGLFLYGPFAFIPSHMHLRFGLSLSAAGALVMLFGVGGFLFAIQSARLVARLGERGLALLGGSLMALSLLATAFAPVWAWAPVSCTVMGFGFYMLHNTLQVNGTQMAPERRGAAMACFAASFFLGQSAGVSLGGPGIEWLGTAGLMVAGAAGVLAVGWVFGRQVALNRPGSVPPAASSTPLPR